MSTADTDKGWLVPETMIRRSADASTRAANQYMKDVRHIVRS
jgi:hypothetical protein